MNELIKLENIDKGEDYVGIKYDVVINEDIVLHNVDIIIHRVIDFIDLFTTKRNQTDDVLNKLEKYKKIEYGMSVDYMIPINDNNDDNSEKLSFIRIVMSTL